MTGAAALQGRRAARRAEPEGGIQHGGLGPGPDAMRLVEGHARHGLQQTHSCSIVQRIFFCRLTSKENPSRESGSATLPGPGATGGRLGMKVTARPAADGRAGLELRVRKERPFAHFIGEEGRFRTS